MTPRKRIFISKIQFEISRAIVWSNKKTNYCFSLL